VTSGAIAALIAVLALAFIEGIGRFYPSRETWTRLRRARGFGSMRAMRERFEAAAERRPPRAPFAVLFGLAVVWVAAASLLDKRWWEVVMDVLPYVIVLVALLRTPVILGKIARRMRDRERDAGMDPDAPSEGDGGPTALAL